MPDNDDLLVFCTGQASRLGVFRDWNFMENAGRLEFVRFLAMCVARERIALIVDQAVMLPQMPTLAALRDIKDKLFPPLPDASGPLASLDCPDCAGTGWMGMSVGAYQGVAKCRCGGNPRAYRAEEEGFVAASEEERAERNRRVALERAKPPASVLPFPYAGAHIRRGDLPDRSQLPDPLMMEVPAEPLKVEEVEPDTPATVAETARAARAVGRMFLAGKPNGASHA